MWLLHRHGVRHAANNTLQVSLHGRQQLGAGDMPPQQLLLVDEASSHRTHNMLTGQVCNNVEALTIAGSNLGR
jgi:hypothetical protein